MEGPRIKRLRKGTKSCIECRRRKIKCVFETEGSTRCKDCIDRGLDCIDQEQAQLRRASSGDDDSLLKNRVNQLEDLVKNLVTKLDSKPKKPAQQQDAPQIARRNTELPAAPYIGLFHNDYVEPRGDPPEEVTTATAQDNPGGEFSLDPSRQSELRRTLLSYFPTDHAIKILTREFGQWWLEWNFINNPGMKGPESTQFDLVVNQAMYKGSPVDLSKSLLGLGLCMQQIPASYDYSHLQLKMAPYDLADFYARQVYRLVLSDDDLVGTLEGIECLTIYNKFCQCAGRPRRAWLAHRRALTLAQLLNLHRREHRSHDSPAFSSIQKESIWAHLYVLDHCMALIFGQPYTIPLSHSDFDLDSSKLSPQMVAFVQLGAITARISDRNHEILQTSLQKTFSTTLEIDQDLDELRRSLPAKLNLQNRVPHVVTFMHEQVRVLLHLPFMLKSATEPRYHHCKVATVDASRKMIQAYHELRCSGAAAYVCKVIDFQVFTAAMLLLLNIHGFSRDEDHEEDWRLIRMTINLLRDAVGETGGKVSQQCLRALELFLSCSDNGPENCAESVKIVVPFYGTLVLGPSENMKNLLKESKPPNQLCTPPASSSDGTTPSQSSAQTPLLLADGNNNPFMFELNQGYFPHLGQGLPQADNAFLNDWEAFTAVNTDLDHDWNWALGGTQT